MKTLQLIERAFSHRQKPALFLLPEQLAKHEYADVATFLGIHWSSVTCDQLERHFEAIYWFTPETFCYYLPGIFSAGIKEERPELIVNHSLIGMLDRSPEPDLWDEFFLSRWQLLNMQECEATQEWVLWLASCEGAGYSEHSLSRAFDTLGLLKPGRLG